MLYTILLTVCMLDSSATCREVNIQVHFDVEYTQGIPPTQCMLAGQQEIAAWIKDHPEWKVQKWRCPPPNHASSEF